MNKTTEGTHRTTVSWNKFKKILQMRRTLLKHFTQYYGILKMVYFIKF